MTVHAGAGDAEHNRGTLVNALLFHFGKGLSDVSGGLRPGIVHRLDKETSGLIIVAKNDGAHRRLAEMFSTRALQKTYVALVHGRVAKDEGTVELPIGRDPVRRVRMSTREAVGARQAVTHWRVLERIGDKEKPGPLGVFTLLEVQIETGRTHQIRVHMAALGHPVVGDTLYRAPGRLKRVVPKDVKAERSPSQEETEPTLERNFLHAAELRFAQPRTGKMLELRSPLPPELAMFLGKVRGSSSALVPGSASKMEKDERGPRTT
jgi:23S rRNA pseudouridine1911/1915/1917 synthase